MTGLTYPWLIRRTRGRKKKYEELKKKAMGFIQPGKTEIHVPWNRYEKPGEVTRDRKQVRGGVATPPGWSSRMATKIFIWGFPCGATARCSTSLYKMYKIYQFIRFHGQWQRECGIYCRNGKE
jgi:hypothetical protein